MKYTPFPFSDISQRRNPKRDFVLEADVEQESAYSALPPAALEGLFQRSYFSSPLHRQNLGHFQ